MKKIKIGILTFHWATNYGAVLQAYALQQYLVSEGFDTVIINYVPKRLEVSLMNCFRSRSISDFLKKMRIYRKELRIRKFRNENLIETKKYSVYNQISSDLADSLDFVITGSDQVWNQYFITNSGDTQFNTSYFLSCFNQGIKKIAYAVSFGCVEYPEALSKKIAPLITNFQSIGVRENSGKSILKAMNYDESVVVCDPTLLLNRSKYFSLFSGFKTEDVFTFVYLLRDDTELLLRKVKKDCNLTNTKVSSEECLESWLANIFYSNLVITNSYHGMIFSILFEKDFIVLLERDEPMNDRFYTLLSRIDLLNRVCYVDEVVNTVEKKIDWEYVKLKLKCYTEDSKLHLSKSIKS